ncbi:succinate dehydrogenase, cytochrome b556 subunit [Chromatium okenii]|uniref:succinate dehydrogenase, cytochrome b556 subunit n=1 Tax=Chromatium okenii TaxID=61644 RepID=UPI0026F35E4B|nr:succinate dehydrogenase, cytochrome b556 subunit [Chromatium okenii]MBV5308322.1 succinate dehydrogenase, cytochrome b556 subunit [Chromatium okenii]MBV5311292.1 succinate dehydrogenase, cytochrome b556 subunit [Chromatium okenii]
MSKSRPIFLTLWQIKLPPSGIVSILHRLSGVLMVLALPIAAMLFELALTDTDGFNAAAAWLNSWSITLALLLLLWSLLHHLLAGLRHLLLDLDIGLDRPVARRTAQIVLIAAPTFTVALLAAGRFFA